MEVWILIIGLYLRGDGGGISPVTIEFISKQNCEVAARALASKWHTLAAQTRWVCVRKK